ncbi:MAG: hypothetical protein KDC44_07805 [Phaeodactylibacter sp.]|nr:hypothetical protein [Phaeodactylibacter sp.]
MIRKILQYIEAKPKRLFLIDGLGALLSAFLLGVVLVRLEGIFGIPVPMLYFLAGIPLFFVGYDWYAYQRAEPHPGLYLKGIAWLNLVYCCLSIGLASYHAEVIRFWGWYYIISEIAVIAILILLEFRTAKKRHP